MEILKRVFTSELRGIDDEEQTLTAFVSTNTRDRMDEVLMPDGVDMRNYKKNPIVLWAHDYSSPPIGKSLWIKKEGDGVPGQKGGGALDDPRRLSPAPFRVRRK